MTGGTGACCLLTDVVGDGNSGTLPAASLSKIDSCSSASDPWLARRGAGGRGLLRSVCDLSDKVDAELLSCDCDNGFAEERGGTGGNDSSFNSILINLPCL